MIIQGPESHRQAPGPLSNKLLPNCLRIGAFVLVLVGVFGAVTTFFGVSFLLDGQIRSRGMTIVATRVDALLDWPSRLAQQLYYRVKGYGSDIERIDLHVKQKQMHSLAYDRQHRLDSKWVPNTDFKQYQYVPAKLVFNDRVTKAKIRLKGDRGLHVLDESKWSFRVKVKGDNTLLGMKKFSLSLPRSRNYVWEWVYQEAAKNEGLITLRNEFVNVFLNGRDLGVYHLEEHFEKRLVENNEHLDGPLLKFYDEIGPVYRLALAPVVALDAKKWTSGGRREVLEYAVGRLESFKRGELKVSEVFDATKIATLFALADLFGTHHGVVARHLRFYYNPITRKLEPIPLDGHHGEASRAFEHSICTELAHTETADMYRENREWFSLFFHNEELLDPVFLTEYGKALRRFSKVEYLDSFFEKIAAPLEQNLMRIYRDFPLYEEYVQPGMVGPLFHFDRQEIYKRQEHLRADYEKKQYLIGHLTDTGEDSVGITVKNISYFPLEVIRADLMVRAPESEDTSSKGRERPFLIHQIILPQVGTKANPKPLEREIRIPLKAPVNNIKQIRLSYRIVGDTTLRTQEVYLWSDQGNSHSRLRSDGVESNHTEFPFITTNEVTKTILFATGEWRVNRPLVLPPGYTVSVSEGTRLDLTNNAFIKSFSPLRLEGTKAEPITLDSSDKSGQGIVVLNTGRRKSTFNHVVFRGMTRPQQGAWALSSSLTFYESDVELLNSEFRENRAEDLVNIKRSRFLIRGSKFVQAHSDALDSDFSNGSVENTTFTTIGNDAVDLSGGSVSLGNVIISGVGDKAISAGEGCQLEISEAQVEGSEIGIASKDSAEVSVRGLVLRNTKAGLVVYNKKSEFGAGTMTLSRLDILDTAVNYLVEDGSTLVVDGRSVPVTHMDVKNLLYGEQYGKSSR